MSQGQSTDSHIVDLRKNCIYWKDIVFFQGTTQFSYIWKINIRPHLVATLTAGSQSADLKMYLSGTKSQ